MKNFFSKFLIPLLLFTTLISPVVVSINHSIAVPAPIVMIALVAVAILLTAFSPVKLNSKRTHIVSYGVEVEIWANYIIERLWKDNSFLQKAFSDDDKVLAGKIVHIPQPGAKPTVIKNRNSYPATAVKRTDTDILYSLEEYTTDPTHIVEAEKVELSYDKINSVYGDHAGQLAEDVAGDMIIKWLLGIPQTSIIKTTGAATSEILTGATGQRKVLVHENLRKAQKLMNKQNVPATERYAMLSSDMLDQLVESLSSSQYKDFSEYVDAKEGVIGRLYGFDILQRSETVNAVVTAGDVVINPYGTAIATGAIDVSFCWQKNAVTRALGEVKFFENPDRAEYYGDVYSALVRFGGRRRRADNLGIVAIAQEIV